MDFGNGIKKPKSSTPLYVKWCGSGELRQSLGAMGVRQSQAAFSQLMLRLLDANYVDSQSVARLVGGQKVHGHCYEITDAGLVEWTSARKFYLNLSPPSADMTSVGTDEGQTLAYDRETRVGMIRREVEGEVCRFASAVLGRSVPMKGMKGSDP